jgi:hypothetical protein
MRFLILCAVIVATFFVLSRTQVNHGARLITRSGAVVEGTISRDFLSGDFVVHGAAGVQQIPQDEFAGMAYEGSAISMPIAWLGGFMILAVGIWAAVWPSKRRQPAA